MVALSEQFHHPGARPGLQVTCYGLQRCGESGESKKSVDSYNHQGSMITDQKRRTSNDLFIDHYSLVFERSAGANEIILCGYPDNNRVSTDIGTGLNDPDTGLWYIRNRTYNSIPGTVLRQEPKSRQATGVATRVLQRDPIGYAGGINLYEYADGRAVVAVDPEGTLWGPVAYLCGHLAEQAARAIADALKAAVNAAGDRRKIDACPPPEFGEEIKCGNT